MYNNYLVYETLMHTFLTINYSVTSIYSVVNLPVIIRNPKSQPLDLTNNFTNVTLTCEADGASSYYWERQHGSIPPGTTGVNTSYLTIINLQLKDDGHYRCVAVNASGSTESEYAKLTLKRMDVYIHCIIVKFLKCIMINTVLCKTKAPRVQKR